MNQARIGTLLLLVVGFSNVLFAQSGTDELFKLETTIPMADVQGRIDHLSIDLKGLRLFVAALGNNSLEVIDLKENKRIHTINGLAEPQGIAYIPSTNRVFVANGKDGSVRAFDAASWKLLNSTPYGDDADNLRFDQSSGHVWVGYGGGALGEFDAEGTKLAGIKLGAHPESFPVGKKWLENLRQLATIPEDRRCGPEDANSFGIVECGRPAGQLSDGLRRRGSSVIRGNAISCPAHRAGHGPR
jgi:YVTN family beta-propeller protein